MQFRDSNNGEGKSPRGPHTEVGSSGKHSVITADDDVLREARERNTTLESPLQHETVLRNCKKKPVNYEPYQEQHEPEQGNHELHIEYDEPELYTGMYNKDREWKTIS